MKDSNMKATSSTTRRKYQSTGQRGKYSYPDSGPSLFSNKNYQFGKAVQLSELNDPEDKIQVHGSSLYATLDDMQANSGLREFNPDVGYYFDAGWGKVVTWPNRFIAWRDMGLPDNLDFTIDMLQESHKNIMEGRTVEIGCVGGKGRTGTFMALLMWWHERVVHDYYRESGQYYIDRVREEYLPEAIETLQQEEYIKSIVGHQP